MAKNDAVTAVTGEIFREGWSKVRGSRQGLGQKQNQMTRAASGSRAAVFKPVRGGGCHTKAQLVNQLEYLTTKSSHIVDSRGVLDGKKQLTADEIKSLAKRFTNRWDDGFRPKMGHTTHMLMSFPIGTKGEDVRDIASGVCERFFANEDRNFDYLIAIHEDRAHPHAHVVLNRRSQEGEYFYLGRDHHFNYDDFRVAMVEEAEKLSVRLEATKRIDRGVVTYAPRTKEIYAAKAEGRTPVARERVGQDLDRALAEIANTSEIYRSLAAEASAENREDIANALFRAGEMLAQGEQLEQNGEIYMTNTDSFDDLRGRFAERAERVEQFVRDAPDAVKAKYEKQLNAIYQGVSHMQPLGVRSSTLTEKPSDTGVYSETNINAELVGKMREPEIRAQIETALRGTDISSSAVIDRIENGAGNAALERQWIADDLAKIAKADGLNLERKEDLEVTAAKLDQVHVQLGTALERAEVLRQTYATSFEINNKEVMRQSEFEAAKDADYRDIITPPKGYVRESEHMLDYTGGAAQNEAQDMRMHILEKDHPEIARVIEHERDDKINDPFEAEGSRQAYRDEIERELSDEQVEALKQGESKVLDEVIDDRLDRLYAAKAYLQSDEATANSEATREVVSEIAEEEYDAQRLKHVQNHNEKGQTHG